MSALPRSAQNPDSDLRMIDIARVARAVRQRLYLDEHGELRLAPYPQPGWVRIAIKVKSPTEGRLEPLPCAA